MNVRTLSIARSVAVIGSTAALIAGATFAAVTSNPVTISGISLASADAGVLNVFDFGSGGPQSFTTDTSNPGAASTPINLELTTADSALQPFYLQNTDSTKDLKISVTANTPGGSLNPSNVQVTFWDDNSTPAPIGSATLASLQSSATDLTKILPHGTQGDSGNRGSDHDGNYNVSFKLLAPSSGFDTLSGLVLTFVGTPTP